MQFVVNNIAHEIPLNLPDITLGRFVDYYDKHGRELDKKLGEIINRKPIKESQEEDDKEDFNFSRQKAIDDHLDNEAIAWISFWTEAGYDDIKDTPKIIPLLNQYRTLRAALNETEQEKIFPLEIMWHGDEWGIQDYTVNASSAMDFNEIITSKEIIRQIHAVGKGRWDALPYLCAVFFRKKDEVFSDALIIEEGERMKLMNELPMQYALKVSFFLKNCASIWRSTSACLARRAVAKANLN